MKDNLLPWLPECRVNHFRFSVALQRDLDGVAGSKFAQCAIVVLDAADFVFAQLRNHITRLQAGPIRGPVFANELQATSFNGGSVIRHRPQ